MATVTLHTAKTTLARVEAGEEIILARGKHPIAKLVPFKPPAKRRQAGRLRGLIDIGPEFFDPLPEEELALWA